MRLENEQLQFFQYVTLSDAFYSTSANCFRYDRNISLIPNRKVTPTRVMNIELA